MPKRSSKADADEHHSVSMRKISNGYVVSTSKSGAKGYTHSEEYHASKPTIGATPAKSRPAAKKGAAKPNGKAVGRAMASAWK